MKSPTLQLDQYFLTRLQVDHTFPASSPTIKVASVTSSLDYEVGNHRNEPRRRMLRLKVEFQESDDKQQKVGYRIQCEIVGFFSFTESTPPGKEEIVIRVNGFNLLYGTLRGVLATTTAIFPGGRFSVPNVMPNEIVADIENRREQERQKAAAAAAAVPAAQPAPSGT
jgi:hypothetical protein